MDNLLNAQHPVVMGFRTGGWGDRLLTMPALRALETLFPNRLTLICENLAGELIFNGLHLRSICEVDLHPVSASKVEFDSEAVARKVGACDLLLSIIPGYFSAMGSLIERLSPVRSVGFDYGFNVTLPLDFNRHASELAFDIPRYLDPLLKIEDFATPVFAPRYERQARELREIVPPELRILAIHAETKPNKMWPPSQFTTLLQLFLDRHPNFVVFVVGTKNLSLEGGRHDDRIISCFGLPLPAVFCLVGLCDLFLGVDSCMLHAADLYQVPGVGLFGPTSHIHWGFRFSRSRHVRGDGTMESIEVEEVLEALESLILDSQMRSKAVIG
jgi:hypothetical protein